MHATWALIVAGFRRYSRYRGALIGGALTNSVFGLLRASILQSAITTNGGVVGGYAASAAVTYAWVTQALIAPVHVFTWSDLADRVRSGDVAVDLARPLDLQVQYGAADAGRAGAVLVPRALPPVLIGALTFGLTMPGDPLAYLAGVLSLVLGIGISFGCRYLVNLTSIWLLDVRGMLTVYITVSMVLCGLVVPVSWFPPWLAHLAAATPFPSMLQAPTDVFTGRVPVTEPGRLLVLLATQAGWLAAVLGLGQVVQRLGTRRLVVQGG